ncbi:FTR1 family protein [Bacillus sp. CGMCC 1.16607]|uniref:FTR1 family protein n=1 Tax=Bacillus sp. CGMCC 1.16607 TaxID=3351842 RepID=UPI00363C2E91
MRVFYKAGLFVLTIFLFVSAFADSVLGQNSYDDLYIEIGDAIMKTKEADWVSVNTSIDKFNQLWQEIKAGEKAVEVNRSLTEVQNELVKSEKDADAIGKALSSLSKALASYHNAENPSNSESEKAKLTALIPYVDELSEIIQNGQLEEAKAKYEQLLAKWTSYEVIVRNESVVSYGEIETGFALLRISLTQTPPDQEKALKSAKKMKVALDNFINGKITKKTTSDHSLSEVIALLEKSELALEGKEPAKASDHLNQVLLIWPAVEGEVRTKDTKLYASMENEIPAAISLLNSEKKDILKAKSIVNDLQERLQLLSGKTSYSYIDALLILLREGLEALLIITGLLAFLKKTNHQDKQGWIWGGVFGGIVASAILAIVMNVFFSKLTAASSREYIEGVIGIIAVVMMLTVGAWLHKKTNIAHWNQYIKENLGNALAKGSLLSMTLLSFLSIFREGAETIIFYAGMAPSMEMNQLILGIGIAIVILVILGFVIIRYSSVIPMRPFFITATLLIYVLSFKMLGVSIHALQVANTLPVHSLANVPYYDGLGFFPTLETIIPQFVLIVMIIGTTIYVNKSGKSQHHAIAK